MVSLFKSIDRSNKPLCVSVLAISGMEFDKYVSFSLSCQAFLVLRLNVDDFNCKEKEPHLKDLLFKYLRVTAVSC